MSFFQEIEGEAAAEVIGAFLDVENDGFRLTRMSCSSREMGVFG